MARNNDTRKLSLRFENDKTGGKKFVLTHDGNVYSEKYEKERFYELVNNLVLRTKERAALLYTAADFCSDSAEREWLIGKAWVLAKDGNRIEDDCTKSNIKLTQFSDANSGGGGFVLADLSGGSRGSPPPRGNFILPTKAFEISEQCREMIATELEGWFVDYYQGGLALTALGLENDNESRAVTWLDKQYTLTATVQFLLGLKELPLLEDMFVNRFFLPAGMYGNKNKKIVTTRGGGDNHWRVVAARFQDKNGDAFKASSLRATAARNPRAYQREISEVLYIFRHFIFEPGSSRPLDNGLYHSL